MIRALYNGVSGMKAASDQLSNISNNVANNQTIAYKKQTGEFAEVFYQQLRSPSAPSSQYAGTNPMDVGNGVIMSAISNDFTQGNVTYVNGQNNMAIQGDGFFVIGDYSGNNRLYTRAGNFDMSKENQLTTKGGQYVLGWNADALTGELNTGASLQPIELPIGKVSHPVESTWATISGNLDISMKNGQMHGLQIPSYDTLGQKHDIDLNFIKTDDNTFHYVAVPVDQFKPSDSITSAVFRPSSSIAQSLQKGDYLLNVSAPSNGNVDIEVVAPDGSTVLTQTIPDVNQKLSLGDGTNNWFAIEYVGGQGATSASFTIGEVGTVEFNSIGQVQNITGSGVGGNPMVSYAPDQTGQIINIDLRLTNFTGLSSDNTATLVSTDGSGASTLTNYRITDGGKVDGYYSDGTIRTIAQVALATFTNPAGLTRVGAGGWLPTPNSGVADIGVPETSSRGQIKAQALEQSNVDLAQEFVDMMSSQKMYQANAKVIQTADTVLNTVINLQR